MKAPDSSEELVLGDQSFLPGDRGIVQIPVGHLITHEMVRLTVHVRRGERPGPRLLLCAALHGDEINGVEVVRRLLSRKMRSLRGDLIAIPVANLPAFLSRSRYLPDRRDLNRLFPGSAGGSFGARLARILTELSKQCTHGIDLHTGAVNRPNLPQIRFASGNAETMEMARAFGAPVMIESTVREGSFREIFASADKPMLMFEGGEAEILDPAPVRIGLRGIVNVMRHLEMLAPARFPAPHPEPALCLESWWERAPRGGIYAPSVEMGAIVKPGTILGKVGDPFGLTKTTIRSERAGIVIGRAKNAVVDEGDGIFHIAATDSLRNAARTIAATKTNLDQELDQAVFDDALED